MIKNAVWYNSVRYKTNTHYSLKNDQRVESTPLSLSVSKNLHCKLHKDLFLGLLYWTMIHFTSAPNKLVTQCA